MAVVAYLSPQDLGHADRDLLERPLNAFRALAHSPRTLRTYVALVRHFQKDSKLDPRIRELALLQVGWSSGCSYEWAHHVQVALDNGVSERDIRHLVDDNAGLDTQLDAVALLALRAAREMFNGAAASEPVVKQLEERLDTEQAVDLVVLISFYIGLVRMLDTLQIDVEPDYMPYLRRFPLGTA